MKYDCLIIGGGVSGLTAALVMAKNGYHTALLESSRKTAPTIRGFKRQGLFFDTGFHYTGGLSDGEPLDIFFQYLGLSGKIEKYPFDENGFDTFRCLEPNFEFPFPYGYNRIRERFSKRFPEETKAIDEYLNAVKHVYHSQSYINLDIDTNNPGLSVVHGPSLKEFLDRITDNEMLKCILSMHCLLHGVAPEEVSFFSHALVAGSYYESVYGIKGGGFSLAEAFDARLKELKVDVFCNREAKEILLSGENELSGVMCGDKEILYCEHCISTIHPQQLLAIVPHSAFRPAYRKRIEALEDTCSAIMVYVKTVPPLKEIERANLFLFPSPSFPDPCAADPIDKRPMFIARARQDEGKAFEEGCIIICPEPHTGTEYWSTLFPTDDPDAYQSYKHDMTRRIITHIETSCPEFKGRITHVESATPVTLKRYTNSPRGGIYGVKHKIDQYNPMAATRIKGLFLAGQATTAPGVLGAVVSGFLACGNIIGHEKLREELKACI
ncbi:MAG: NAD(P)/FAD-dependent oxidoreductase [Syntrophus sp. (in: bacteria)]|nr:NAD(P)/FAD-dependent oxidoreductase [Syntrophus sp. (in: bacteria)]